jgi:hypothetical protein
VWRCRSAAAAPPLMPAQAASGGELKRRQSGAPRPEEPLSLEHDVGGIGQQRGAATAGSREREGRRTTA